MHTPPFPLRSAPAANDDTNAVRLVPLIGALHGDGRLERYAVVQLLPTPARLLRRPRP